MNNRLSKQTLNELWNTTQRMLNPMSECFDAAQVERFAEQHWRCGERSLDLLTKAQAHWLQMGTSSLGLNGSQGTVVQQSARTWMLWSRGFLRLQQAAWMQWLDVANGFNPLSLASVVLEDQAWRNWATIWQQGAQKTVSSQQSLVAAPAQGRKKLNDSNRAVLPTETPSGQRTRLN